MKKIITVLFAYAIVLMPAMVFAAEDLGKITTLFESFGFFINDVLIPLVFAIALLMFLFGIFQFFILGGGDEEKRKQGRQMMMYSIAGFVVMISIFGIVNLVAKGLGFDQDNSIKNLPTIGI